MIRIVTDSSADIPAHIAEAFDITIVPLLVIFGNKTYREGIDITHSEFYERLRREAPNIPKTSVPSVLYFKRIYRKLLRDADHVVSIHLSSLLSGSYNTARFAASQVDPTRITVIDSRSVSMCLGWTVISAAEMAIDYRERDEIVTHIRAMLPRLRIPSFLDTLKYIKYGGRIGSASAFLSSALDMKPILHLSEGMVAPLARVRTRRGAMERLVEMAHELGPFEDLAVMHTHAPDLAKALVRQLDNVDSSREILIAETGVAMGTHTGPNSVGLCAVLAKAA